MPLENLQWIFYTTFFMKKFLKRLLWKFLQGFPKKNFHVFLQKFVHIFFQKLLEEFICKYFTGSFKMSNSDTFQKSLAVYSRFFSGISKEEFYSVISPRIIWIPSKFAPKNISEFVSVFLLENPPVIPSEIYLSIFF